MRAIGILALLGLLGTSTLGQPEIILGGSKSSDKQSSDKPVEFAHPELARLEIFIGPWSVAETHFDAKGEVVASAKGAEEIVWTLDHHAIRRSYHSGAAPTTFRALGMLTWNAADKRYHGNWYDNTTSNGPTTVKGDWNDATKTMTFDVDTAGADGNPLKFKVVENFDSGEKRTATTYQVEGTSIIKRLEVVYHRTTPCPDKIRMLLGG